MKLHSIDWTGLSDRVRLAQQVAAEYISQELGHTDYYIVGGFLRDTMDDKPFKDVDIFIPGPEPLTDDDGAELEYDLSTNYPVEVDGIELNIIHMNGAHTLDTLLTRCDVGICQIGMDTDGRVYATDEYVNDVANKTLTVTRKSRWGHLARVIAKYPEHTVIDRFHNQHSGNRMLELQMARYMADNKEISTEDLHFL